MNKFVKTALVIIIIASALMVVGAILKSKEIEKANYIMGLAFVIEIVVGGMLIIHLVKSKKK
ncbi:hypothetical protein [Flavobacterium sp.]|jgi:hypothetical protein|uniref:hypothetical protein n=1 Tax=Flavobacterium sp. TaxID=239 RepID=UPI0035B31CBC